MLTWDIALSDWISWLKSLPSESIHCFVTSPPYWGLRDYGVDGQLGLEKTPEEYVAKMVAGFREVRRVLRPDGTLWLNMGDCYINQPNQRVQSGDGTRNDVAGWKQATNVGSTNVGSRWAKGYKAKDLLGLPWMLAFALRADGWYLRAQCPWIKRNSMPESVTDRPGTATETIFLLSKSQRYFYDAEAVKMPAAGTAHMRYGKDRDVRHSTNGVGWGYADGEQRALSPKYSRTPGVNPKAKMPGKNSRVHQDRDPQHSTARKSRQNESFSAAVISTVTTRGRRNHDWFMDSWEGLLTDDEGDPLAFIVNPAPFSEAHFATFPPALVEPCIKAGTSEKGCCAACGAPWERIVEKSVAFNSGSGKAAEKRVPSGWHQSGSLRHPPGDQQYAMRLEGGKNAPDGEGAHSTQAASGDYDIRMGPVTETRTIGWEPTCDCNAGDPIPCTVADPFSGAGTTCLVSVRLGRSFKGSELNPDYREMSIRRVREDAPLFNLQTHASVPLETEQLVLPQPALLPLPDDTAS